MESSIHPPNTPYQPTYLYVQYITSPSTIYQKAINLMAAVEWCMQIHHLAYGFKTLQYFTAIKRLRWASWNPMGKLIILMGPRMGMLALL